MPPEHPLSPQQPRTPHELKAELADHLRIEELEVEDWSVAPEGMTRPAVVLSEDLEVVFGTDLDVAAFDPSGTLVVVLR